METARNRPSPRATTQILALLLSTAPRIVTRAVYRHTRGEEVFAPISVGLFRSPIQ